MTHSGVTEFGSDSGVRLLRNHGLAELVLDRAAKRNALSYEMWSAIPHLVAQVEADNAVSVLIVRGAGDHFSAGADISEFEARRTHPHAVVHYGEIVEQAEKSLLGMHKPSIAMISGYCLGGGCELALACDMRVASADAILGITAARLGIVYSFLSTYRLRGRGRRLLRQVHADHRRPHPSRGGPASQAGRPDGRHQRPRHDRRGPRAQDRPAIPGFGPGSPVHHREDHRWRDLGRSRSGAVAARRCPQRRLQRRRPRLPRQAPTPVHRPLTHPGSPHALPALTRAGPGWGVSSPTRHRASHPAGSPARPEPLPTPAA